MGLGNVWEQGKSVVRPGNNRYEQKWWGRAGKRVGWVGVRKISVMVTTACPETVSQPPSGRRTRNVKAGGGNGVKSNEPTTVQGGNQSGVN